MVQNDSESKRISCMLSSNLTRINSTLKKGAFLSYVLLDHAEVIACPTETLEK